MKVATKIGIVIISILIAISALSYLYSDNITDVITPSDVTVDTTITEDVSEEEFPLFLTTMTHMEGGSSDDIDETVFWEHVAQLEYGMGLADEYDAVLTIESEKPFALANEIWGYNMMAEIMNRGHGVGTHCDIAAKERDLPADDLTKLFLENKELVDNLIGAENNHGCSGGGSSNDWVSAATSAGFEYIDGIVGFHLLAISQKNRPDPTWDNEYILAEAFHYSVPAYLADRIYLMKLKDLDDFEHDDDGSIVISNGELGRLDQLHESYTLGSDRYGQDDPLEENDVDALVQIIREVDSYRDKGKVAKLAIYLPSSIFNEFNEDVLRYLFSEMQKLQDEGIMQWSTQWDTVQTYLESEQDNA